MADQLSNDLAALRIAREPAPPSPWGRRILIVGIVGALGWAAWRFGYPAVEARVFKPEVQTTQIVVVSPSQGQAEVTSTGYVVPQRVSKVGAKTPGRIKAMNVREGQVIEAGFVIAELEGADLRAQQQTAKARVLAARAQVQVAKAELADAQQKAKRERNLATKGVGTAAAAEDFEARSFAVSKQVSAAQANVQAAEAEVEALQVSIDYLTITAPIGGTVVTKPSQMGELVGIQAAAIVELVDMASLMVETDVPEGRLHLIGLDKPCEIVLDAFPTERYRGRVKEIVPKVNRTKATVTVKVAFDEPTTKIMPDMAARVSFLAKELDPAEMAEPARVVVPAVAIAERDGQKVVFVLDDDVVHMESVTLGEAVGSGFELLNGPAAGARVVREPDDELTDGQRVKQKGEST
jgi:HlyD family secretion protein